MSFSIYLSNQQVRRTPAGKDDTTAEDVFDNNNDLISISISIFGTTALKHAGHTFIVGGFGQTPWPLDIDYDGAIVIEQLPALLSGLAAGRDVVIDFPGQGIERKIDVKQTGNDDCTLICSSITSWQPNPVQESMRKSELVRMLTNLGIDFFRTFDS